MHDKTNKMTCEPSKDTDQSGHPPSLITHEDSLHEDSLDRWLLIRVPNEVSDQTGQVPRLIWVFDATA